MTNELGDIFSLPFGKTEVMNHTNNNGYVYIKDVFGEPIKTFIDSYEILNNSIKYGSIIPDKIKVICVSGLMIEGRFLELCKIVDAIKNFCEPPNRIQKLEKRMKEEIRIEGKIQHDRIYPEIINRKILWSFAKLFIKSFLFKITISIWAIEYSNKDKYAVIINSIKKI